MNDNDTLKYNKLKFDDIKDVIEHLKDPKNISRSYLTELFSNRQGNRDDNGRIEVLPARYRCTDYFDLPANTLICQPNEVKDTTLGIFVFNSLCINNAFGGKVGYVNAALNDKNREDLIDKIGAAILKDQLSVKEFAEFINAVVWLGYQNELFMPGISLDLIVPNKEIAKLKLKLLNEHKHLTERKAMTNVEVAEYADKIEKPLLAKAKEISENNYAGKLFELGKPTIGNQYKNSNITNGPIQDPTTGKYKINTNSYNEGINDWNFDVLANKSLMASYCRGVNTQVGGTYAKYVGILMQTVKAGPRGSDCHTKGYLDFEVTKFNKSTIEFNYAIIDGGDKEVILTEQILNGLVGKRIKMRSPIFCKNPNYLCNHCIGERTYLLGITNIGLTGNIPFDTQKNISMKAAHDVTVKAYDANVEDFVVFEK